MQQMSNELVSAEMNAQLIENDEIDKQHGHLKKRHQSWLIWEQIHTKEWSVIVRCNSRYYVLKWNEIQKFIDKQANSSFQAR